MSSFRARPGLGGAGHPRRIARRHAAVGTARHDHYGGRGRAAERKLRRSASGGRSAGGLRCQEALLVGPARSERTAFSFPGVDGFEHAEEYRGEPRMITMV
jgi:hypothetical protein